MGIFFTSDLHLGHVNIVKYRPGFSDVDDMNRTIIDNWNSLVENDDIVYILGDLCMGTIRETIELVRELKGTKFLVPGNHDRVFLGYQQSVEKSIEMDKLYRSVGLNVMDEIVDFSPEIVLSHFPYEGDHTPEDRYVEYRPKREPGRWLLHGHVHDEWLRRDNQITSGLTCGITTRYHCS